MALPTPPSSRSSSRSSNIYNPHLYPLPLPTPSSSPSQYTRRKRSPAPPPLPLHNPTELRSFFSPCSSDSDSDFPMPTPNPSYTLAAAPHTRYQREPPTPPPRTPLPPLNFTRKHTRNNSCATPTFGPPQSAARQDRDRLLVQTQKAHLRRFSAGRLEVLHHALERAERAVKLEEIMEEEKALRQRMRELRKEREELQLAAKSMESWWSSDEDDEEDGYESEVEIEEVGARRGRESLGEVWFDAVWDRASPVCVVAGVEIEMI